MSGKWLRGEEEEEDAAGGGGSGSIIGPNSVNLSNLENPMNSSIYLHPSSTLLCLSSISGQGKEEQLSNSI